MSLPGARRPAIPAPPRPVRPCWPRWWTFSRRPGRAASRCSARPWNRSSLRRGRVPPRGPGGWVGGCGLNPASPRRSRCFSCSTRGRRPRPGRPFTGSATGRIFPPSPGCGRSGCTTYDFLSAAAADGPARRRLRSGPEAFQGVSRGPGHATRLLPELRGFCASRPEGMASHAERRSRAGDHDVGEDQGPGRSHPPRRRASGDLHALHDPRRGLAAVREDEGFGAGGCGGQAGALRLGRAGRDQDDLEDVPRLAAVAGPPGAAGAVDHGAVQPGRHRARRNLHRPGAGTITRTTAARFRRAASS